MIAVGDDSQSHWTSMYTHTPATTHVRLMVMLCVNLHENYDTIVACCWSIHTYLVFYFKPTSRPVHYIHEKDKSHYYNAISDLMRSYVVSGR